MELGMITLILTGLFLIYKTGLMDLTVSVVENATAIADRELHKANVNSKLAKAKANKKAKTKYSKIVTEEAELVSDKDLDILLKGIK